MRCPPEPSAWTNDFSGGSGIVAGAALGYDWGAVRVEAEYTFRVAAYNDESGMDIFDDVSLDKREQEIELAVGRVGDLQGRGLFANVLWGYRQLADMDAVRWRRGRGRAIDARLRLRLEAQR